VRKGDDLTTFIVLKVEKIRSLNLPDPEGPAQAWAGKLLVVVVVVAAAVVAGGFHLRSKKFYFSLFKKSIIL
jgi:hypothetical protein